jgi:hypothetical protein
MEALQARGEAVLAAEGMASYVAWLLDNMEQIQRYEESPQPAEPSETPNMDLPHCPACGCYQWWDSEIESEEICKGCGLCVPYVCRDRRALTFEDEGRVRASDYARGGSHRQGYQRISHFNDLINQLLSRQTRLADPTVIMEVKSRALALREETACLTGLDVRRHLKALGRGRHYDQAWLIASHLSHFSSSLFLPYKLEPTLRRMFKQVQRPFERHKKARKSFLNFRYVLYQFLRALGLEATAAASIPILKSRCRLREHDRIYCAICADLAWDFRPLLPAPVLRLSRRRAGRPEPGGVRR